MSRRERRLSRGPVFLTTECQPSTGECDPAVLHGSDADCPADEREPDGTACLDEGNTCTTDECDGISADCVHTPIDCTFCSQPAKVAVFNEDAYVVATSTANVQASLTTLLHPFLPSTGVDTASINAALAGKELVLIPEQKILTRRKSSGNALVASGGAQAYRDFVEGGGGLIIHATRQNLDQWFLRDVFGNPRSNGGGEFAGPPAA